MNIFKKTFNFIASKVAVSKTDELVSQFANLIRSSGSIYSGIFNASADILEAGYADNRETVAKTAVFAYEVQTKFTNEIAPLYKEFKMDGIEAVTTAQQKQFEEAAEAVEDAINKIALVFGVDLKAKEAADKAASEEARKKASEEE